MFSSLGDFNALLVTEDKNDGLEVDDSDFSNLRNFCSVFNLHDPGFSGPRFTWSNMQQGPDLILERLDRWLINQSVEDLFPKLCVNNLPRESSDHCPMHIGFNYEDVCMPRPFHFMDIWIENPTCRDIIVNSWSVNVVGSPAYNLKSKLLSTKKGLRDWNKSSFGDIQTNISTIRKDLADIQISNPTDTSTTSRLKDRLEYLYNLEELYWKDKSKEVSLMEGDINSPYFHRVTLFRRKRNVISWIKNFLNIILTDRDSIGTSFINYFKNLYSSHPQQFQDEILADLPIKFSSEDNSFLNMPLILEEIKYVVFQMGGGGGKKAPEPDGFTGLFYQKHWHIVGDAVIYMIQTCFRTWNIAKVFNHTNIALIPKVPLAELVSQYRPIWLCIAPIKLDMSKAYDKLEWGFLEKVLTKIGLSNHWIKLINQCVSTVSYFVLLNGSPTGFFQPERVIKDYLQKYCLASGKEINFEKSGILFSRKIPEHRKALLENILEIQSRDLGEKYLGTHTVFQASKIQTHMGILQAVDAKISIWLHKLLSQAARTTSIKHIGQVIPLFQRGAFLMPKHLCKKMDSHLCKFWWGETLDPKDRNAWRILENPNCLLAIVLKSKYFPRTDFLNAKCTGKCSWTWKCLHAIKELIKPFISWIVGGGQFIDHGVINGYLLWTQHPFDNASVQKIVSILLRQLYTPDRKAWDLSKNAILWSIWTGRNNFIFQNMIENLTNVLARARAMLLSRKPCITVSSTTPVSICDKWMHLFFEWIKCNTDGAYDEISGENGAGYAMRKWCRVC
ncbi:uncharacterized protein LOC113342067 [Papaver somniferum]|uniref:uncharacterized protein LOC113342067 n=1 Tax=Papaver somniferum TaxID=3469 RepID=UPI000E6FCBDB|nr:uncharacterized protein LOC113342067 [Papaver somniferum]